MPALLPRKYKKMAVIAALGDETDVTKFTAFKASNFSFEDTSEEKEFEVVSDELGNDEKFITTDTGKISFDVQFVGSGTAGTAPAISPLLRGSGFNEVITATQVAYSPVSSGFEHLTMWFVVDGTVHKLTKARGNVKLDATAGEISKFSFEFNGVGGAVPEALAGTLPTPATVIVPKAVGFEHSPTFTIDAVHLPMQAFSVDSGNTAQTFDLVEFKGTEITERKPTASMTIGAQELATFNTHAIARSGVAKPVVFEHGKTAGEIIRVEIAKAQLGKPQYNDYQGALMHQLDCNILRAAPASQYQFIFK